MHTKPDSSYTGAVALAFPDEIANLERHIKQAMDLLMLPYWPPSKTGKTLPQEVATIYWCLFQALMVVERGLRDQLDDAHSYYLDDNYNVQQLLPAPAGTA